jgi:hypothetical protein
LNYLILVPQINHPHSETSFHAIFGGSMPMASKSQRDRQKFEDRVFTGGAIRLSIPSTAVESGGRNIRED